VRRVPERVIDGEARRGAKAGTLSGAAARQCFASNCYQSMERREMTLARLASRPSSAAKDRLNATCHEPTYAVQQIPIGMVEAR
jgi:hypothetical protein